MKENRMKDVLESIAQRNVPGDINIWPQIAASMERKNFMQTVRTRPALVLALVFLALGLLSGVAYAIGRVAGYIPGVGIVDQSVPLRVLTEPVVMERDGITITVNDAVLTSDKAVVVYTVENIPVDKLSRDENIHGCGASLEEQAHLKLPNGTLLGTKDAYGLDSWDTGYKVHFTFTAIPPDVNEATLIIQCISGATSGALPEHWETTLHFNPAPPQMTVMPVIEVTPSQEDLSVNPLILKNVIQTESGYILIGEFHSTGLLQGARAVQFSQPPVMIDASGQTIPFNLANSQVDLPAAQPLAGVFPWAFEIVGKQFNWPLTITVNTVAAEYPDAQTKFEFDAGSNLHDGQTWDLNSDMNLAGFAVRVLQAFRTADGYGFNFESQATFHAVNLAIENSELGFTGMDDPHHFSSSVTFVGKIPSGKLTVLATHPVVAISGNWQLRWQPENVSTMPMSTDAPQACLRESSGLDALVPSQQIPADLHQKVIVTGPLTDDKEDSADNYGTFVVNLNGSDKHILAQGVSWASPSLDGSEVVYRDENGLYIENIGNGELRLIPNTLPNDDHPLWSPDGTHIVFVRSDEQKLYMINVDGTGLQRLTRGTEAEVLLGWLPDASTLIYAVESPTGMSLRELDVVSGTVTNLFAANTGSEASVSPDGSEIAFFDTIDKMNIGLYVARYDGNNRKLVAQIKLDTQVGQVGVIAPRWSPDGKWLAISIGSTNPLRPETALINPQTCRILPLPIHGIIDAWLH